MAPALTTL